MYTNGASAQILPMQRKTAKRFIRPPLLGHAEGESKPQRQRFEEGTPAGGGPYNSTSHGSTLPFRPFLILIITVFLAKSSGFPKKRKNFFILEKNTAALGKIRGILHSPSLKNLDSKK